MNKSEVRQHYSGVVLSLRNELLGAIERAMVNLPQLHVQFSKYHTDSVTIGLQPTMVSKDAITQIHLERVIDPRHRWDLFIGVFTGRTTIEPGEKNDTWDDAIRWDVADATYPPYEMPVYVRWTGVDRYSESHERERDLGPIEIRHAELHWNGRHWKRIDADAADAIVRGLLQMSMLHDSFEAGAIDWGARWQKVGSDQQPKAGGQGNVWKVRDASPNPSNGYFALKAMKYASGPGQKKYERFLKEIKATSELTHPNIVRLIDWYIPTSDDGTDPYYVMPWADATLFRSRSVKGNVQRALEIGADIANALVHAHKAGYLHRDIKPQNVLLFDVEGKDVPALADFGISLFLADEEGRRLTNTAGETVGSNHYVAPELRGGRYDDVDGRADIYSLGKTLFAAVWGDDPFPLEEIDHPAFDLRKDGSTLALDHFYGLLRCMVVRERERRYHTMEEAEKQIRRALDAVRTGRPYVEGMYSGGRTTRETLDAFRDALSSTNPVRRFDAINDAVGDLSDAILQSLQSEHPGPVYVSAAKRGEQRASAQLIAERMLAVLLPIIASDDATLSLDPVVPLLREPFEAGNRFHRSENRETIWRAASAAALFGAAVVAWRMKRWSHLRTLLRLYASDPNAFGSLAIWDTHDRQSWNWIKKVVGSFDVVQTVDPRSADRAPVLLGVVSWVLAIGVWVNSTLERCEDEILNGSLAALIEVESANELARTFRQQGSVEGPVCAHVFASTTQMVRDRCRELTQSIAAAMVAHPASPVEAATALHETSEWGRWCGFGQAKRSS
ncbi:MAG TPA: serine/threonine-protein kinase [Vicinamibacterales bacterium]|jgi:serine/threonine protein kinase|nr:serine/threonine-protein kinase [Vicinamibacterales bacterium]